MRRFFYIGQIREIISSTGINTPNLYLWTGLIKLTPDKLNGPA
jgi:hypothetical protein